MTPRFGSLVQGAKTCQDAHPIELNSLTDLLRRGRCFKFRVWFFLGDEDVRHYPLRWETI